ncbi:MAG: helix-turn-helix domain-containing protein [Novosphingobium sp.]
MSTPNTVTPLRATETPKRPRKAQPISENAVTVRLPQLCEMLNIGPTKAQELIREGKVESFKVGKTRLITVRSIHALAHGEAA